MVATRNGSRGFKLSNTEGEGRKKRRHPPRAFSKNAETVMRRSDNQNSSIPRGKGEEKRRKGGWEPLLTGSLVRAEKGNKALGVTALSKSLALRWGGGVGRRKEKENGRRTVPDKNTTGLN